MGTWGKRLLVSHVIKVFMIAGFGAVGSRLVAFAAGLMLRGDGLRSIFGHQDNIPMGGISKKISG